MKQSAKKKKKSKRAKQRHLAPPSDIHVYEPQEPPLASPPREVEELLSRARMQWQLGDWGSLEQLDLLQIEHHPARAELALLAGCAALQTGDRQKGRASLFTAIKWGCESRLILRLLIAGVHNSLGRYHALIGNEEKGMRYLQLAGAGLGGDPRLIGEIRRQREWPALPGLPVTKPNYPALPEASLFSKEAAPKRPQSPDLSMEDLLALADTETLSHTREIRSYATNFEDVMLWRVLGTIRGGFYIDIGAEHPVYNSVSRIFYEQGWRGVHVEPTEAYAALLRKDRPDETIIEAAVAAEHGSMTFYAIPETGLSTGDPNIARRHQTKGFSVIVKTVPTITLADLFALAGDRDIHWLKIDVEGMEKDVLQAWGDPPRMPWVVVVESTVPNSTIQTHSLWDSLLTKRDYTCVYFDGLSRFYLSKEHQDLKKAFELPPNIFDECKIR